MPRLEYFLVADNISIDQATNQVSIFEVLEEIGATEFPLPLSRAVAIASWIEDDIDENRDLQVIIRITLSSEETKDFASNFKMLGKRHRTIIRIEGMPITGEGDIKFEVLLNGEYQASHIIEVKKIEIPNP